MEDLSDVEVVFFDVDGTLFDQRLAHMMAIKELSRVYEPFHGVDVQELVSAFNVADVEAFAAFKYGISLDKLRHERSENILRALKIDTAHASELTSVFYDTYPRINAGFKDADGVVKKAQKNHKIGIISNGSREVQLMKLRTLKLRDHFEVMVFSEDLGYRKPDERIFLHAADEMQTDTRKCLYVGDSYRADISGAGNAGMRTCWINHHGEVPDGSSPDIEIKEISQLLNFMTSRSDQKCTKDHPTKN